MSPSDQTARAQKRAFWYQHIECWLAGKLSRKEYCQQQKLSYHSFSWWRSKNLKESSRKIEKNEISFVPAIVKEREQPLLKSSTDMILIFPNQAKLVLPTHWPSSDLMKLLKTLGGLS